MIWTVLKTYEGQIYCDAVSLTEEELEQRKECLRKDAQKFLDQVADNEDVDHIVYYHDDRDKDGNIQTATLYYNMIGMNHKTFLERSKNVSGEIGEVHRSDIERRILS